MVTLAAFAAPPPVLRNVPRRHRDRADRVEPGGNHRPEDIVDVPVVEQVVRVTIVGAEAPSSQYSCNKSPGETMDPP